MPAAGVRGAIREPAGIGQALAERGKQVLGRGKCLG
jgi:hypothetical protein